MKKQLLAGAVAAGLVLGGVNIAVAAPGPNGSNTFGLCTAYFSGSERGQEEKRKAPPFQGLEAAADAADQTVAEYCAANGQRPDGGGGRGQTRRP